MQDVIEEHVGEIGILNVARREFQSELKKERIQRTQDLAELRAKAHSHVRPTLPLNLTQLLDLQVRQLELQEKKSDLPKAERDEIARLERQITQLRIEEDRAHAKTLENDAKHFAKVAEHKHYARVTPLGTDRFQRYRLARFALHSSRQDLLEVFDGRRRFCRGAQRPDQVGTAAAARCAPASP